VPLAFVAGVLLLLATGLIVVAVRASTGRGARARIGAETRSLLAVVATTGLLLAAYFFVAAAPGGLPFDDSWTEGSRRRWACGLG
jgi:multisubunit Na+/H+ antiporter MnhB subunit